MFDVQDQGQSSRFCLLTEPKTRIRFKLLVMSTGGKQISRCCHASPIQQAVWPKHGQTRDASHGLICDYRKKQIQHLRARIPCMFALVPKVTSHLAHLAHLQHFVLSPLLISLSSCLLQRLFEIPAQIFDLAAYCTAQYQMYATGLKREREG